MSIERRDLFKILAATAVSTRAIAQTRETFSPAQRAVLDRLSDILIPTDEQSPGAHAAGVVQYLELAAQLNAQKKTAWTRGLEAVDAEAKAKFAHEFMGCTREQQEQIVELMAANEGRPQTALERFFTSLKPAVIDGYRYSEIGVKQFMRWEGNHYEVGEWKGACHHPEHQA